MKHAVRRISAAILVLVLASAVSYFTGVATTYAKSPIILQWIDGKYGEKFYGVQITLKKNQDMYDVYCTILIRPQYGVTEYSMPIGKIGSENTLREVTARYSNIYIKNDKDERYVMVGETKIADMKDVENHR